MQHHERDDESSGSPEAEDSCLDVAHLADDWESIRKIARPLVDSEHAADDLVQELFVTAMTRPPRIRKNAGGWIRTVLSRTAGRIKWNEYRRRVRQENYSKQEFSEPAAENNDERLHRIRAILRELPAPTREVLQLHYEEGLTLAEISERLDRPPNTIKSRISRGLAVIRTRLDRDERLSKGRAWILVGIQRLRRPRSKLASAFALALGLVLCAGLSIRRIARPTGSMARSLESADALPDPDGGVAKSADSSDLETPRAAVGGLEIPRPPASGPASPGTEVGWIQVVDSDGRGVPGAAVASLDGRARIELGVTSQDGWLREPDSFAAPPNRLLLEVSAEGFALHRDHAARAPEGPHRVSLSDARSNLFCRAQGPDGSFLEGAVIRVSVFPTHGEVTRQPTRTMRTNPEGWVKFSDLSPGFALIDVRHPDFAPQESWLTIEAPRILHSVHLEPGAFIRGRTGLGADHGSKAGFVWFGTGSEGPRGRCKVEADGSFSIGPLHKGRYHAWAVSADKTRAAFADLDLRDGESVLWNPLLRPIEPIEVHLVDEQGVGLGRRQVTVRQARSDTPWRRELRCDAEGRLALAAFPEGDLELVIWNPGRLADHRVEIPGSDRRSRTIVVPSPPSRYDVRGNLHLDSPTDGGLEDGQLLLVGEHGRQYLIASASLGRGDFVFSNVPAGTHTLYWFRPTLGKVRLGAVEVRDRPLDLGSLSPPGSGTLILESQQSPASPGENPRSLRIRSLEGQRWMRPWLEDVYRGPLPEGSLHLYPGRYRLEVIQAAVVIQDETIEIHAGSRLRFELASTNSGAHPLGPHDPR